MDCAKIGELIRSLRLEKGMTQRALAEKLNLSDKTIFKWECGLGCPGVALQLEPVEDEWHIFSRHPMHKENYIRFAAFQSADRAELVRLYPEWDLDFRIKRRSHGNLIWYAPDRGLLYQRI